MTESRFDILVSVRYRHAYFTGNRLKCFKTLPDARSLHFLNRNGMIFKPLADGFSILFESSHNQTTQERESLLDGITTLRFIMSLEDTLFYNYTAEYITNLTDTLNYFHNNAVRHKEWFSNQFLHSGEYVSGTDLLSVKEAGESYFVKPFGIIDLILLKNLPAEYGIRFREKTTYWRYHLLSDYLKGLDSPGIIGPETFSAPVKTVLPDEREALTFVSEKPIGIYESNEQNFQLVEHYEPGAARYKVVMRSLPYPDTKSISLINNGTTNKQNNFSEIFIY